MPENQASSASCWSPGAWRRPAAAPGRGSAAGGDPLRPARGGRAAPVLARARGRPRRLARRGQRRVRAARGGGLARGRAALRAAGAPAVARGRRAGDASKRLTRDAAPVRYDLRPGRPDLARFPRVDWLRSLSAAVRGGGRRGARLPADRRRDCGCGRCSRRTAGRVRGTLAARRRRDPVRRRGAGVHHDRGGARAGAARGRGPRARGHPRAVRQARARAGAGARGRGGHRRRRAARRRARGAASRPRTSSRPASCCPPSAAPSCCAGREERGALIIEDDYDAEYRYDRAPVGALQGLRPDLVVHVGSVSKTLAPALRLGWLIAPAGLARAAARRARGARPRAARARAARARRLHQRGAYDRHLRRTRPRLPAPPRRAARGARARAAGRDVSAAPRPACTSRSTSPAPTSRRSSRPAASAASSSTAPPRTASRRARRAADQLRRRARRGRRPRRGADRLSALRRPPVVGGTTRWAIDAP